MSTGGNKSVAYPDELVHQDAAVGAGVLMCIICRWCVLPLSGSKPPLGISFKGKKVSSPEEGKPVLPPGARLGEGAHR